MRRRATVALGAAAVLVSLMSSPSAGQPRVLLTGQIESIVGIDTTRTRQGTDETLMWGSRYTPQLDGFVWHPRFMTYTLAGTYGDQTTDRDTSSIEVVQTDPYRLEINLFPQAPHTFTLRAARTTVESVFAPDQGRTSETETTTERESIGWTYRGSRVLPSTLFEVQRERTATDTGNGGRGDNQIMTATLQAAKSFGWMNPNVRYRLDRRESGGLGESEATSAIGHTFEYTDRIRVGQRLAISPSVAYRINPAGEGVGSNVNVGLPLAGPLSPTLDGSADFRYQFSQGPAIDHTVTTSGSLTKRFSPDLALGGGLSGVVINGAQDPIWNTGAFTNLTYNPRPHLRTFSAYYFQLNGESLTTAHRTQMSVTSTVVPKHVFGGSYSLNIAEASTGGEQLVSQSWRLTANSSAVRNVGLDAGYLFDVQQGFGDHVAHAANVNATYRPADVLSLEGGLDFNTTSSRGADGPSTEETRYAVRAAASVAALYWLTLSASGQVGVADTVRENRSGTFVTEAVSGGFAAGWRTLRMESRGFLERDGAADRRSVGVRANIAYRFRVWTVGVEGERTILTTAKEDSERYRVLFKLGRPISTLLSWPRALFGSR